MFGFERRELITMRMLFGPRTRVSAVQQALDQCYQFDTSTKTAVILYDRFTKEVCISIEMETDHEVLMGVVLNCTVLDGRALQGF
jgi:hypothetical protein